MRTLSLLSVAVAAFFLLVVSPLAAQEAAIVLEDGGIEFPDGTVQMTATVGRALVPDTGQTGCWDTDGNPRPCGGTGEDGEFQAGVAWPTPRFTDNGDGTVTDNLTGLVWLKDANCPASTKTWQEALDWVATFNGGSPACTDYAAGAFVDWRLANVSEFTSLIDYGHTSPALPVGHPFIAVQSPWYWSSTTHSDNGAQAWVVAVFYGNAGTFVAGSRRAMIG
jgi:hypothetical protein